MSLLRERESAEGLDAAHAALWWAARGEWDRAHEAAQAGTGREADWVHAYLHRVEGDLENARYWYGRAGRAEASGSLDAEWETIAAALGGASYPAPAPPLRGRRA